MSAAAIVEDLEVVEDGISQFDAGSPHPCSHAAHGAVAALPVLGLSDRTGRARSLVSPLVDLGKDRGCLPSDVTSEALRVAAARCRVRFSAR